MIGDLLQIRRRELAGAQMARVRGRLLEPEARRGGPRVIARVFDELCGVDEPAEQAALVRAAVPVAAT